MVEYVVSDVLGLGVQLHDRFLQHLHLFVHVGLLDVHARRLSLRGVERGLQHDVLLVQALLLVFDVFAALLQELLLRLALLQLVMQFLGSLLLLPGFIAHAGDFTLDLQDFIVFLLDQLLDGLQGLVSLLHAEE